MYNKQAHNKHFCTGCFYSGKARVAPEKCTKCGGNIVPISHKLHLPSYKASKTRWKEFFVKSRFFGTGRMNEDENRRQVLATLRKK